MSEIQITAIIDSRDINKTDLMNEILWRIMNTKSYSEADLKRLKTTIEHKLNTK
jgi:hypothetical protein